MSSHVLTIADADRMLPLVRRIVLNARARHRLILRKSADLEDAPDPRGAAVLDHLRSELLGNMGELAAIGLDLLDPETGLVGATSSVDGTPATITWRPGQHGFSEWFPLGGDALSRRAIDRTVVLDRAGFAAPGASTP